METATQVVHQLPIPFPPKPPKCFMKPPTIPFKLLPPPHRAFFRLYAAASCTAESTPISGPSEPSQNGTRKAATTRVKTNKKKTTTKKAEKEQLKLNWTDSLSGTSLYNSDCSDARNADSGWVIGIDPDLSGALAVLKPDNTPQVYDTPHLQVPVGTKVRRRLDARSIIQLLQTIDAPIGTTAYLEQSLPFGQDGKQSWWSVGFAYGLWIGVLVTSGYTVVPVPSSLWKNAFKLSGNGASKDDSRELASTLFPSMSSLLSRKKDHGRAEALLIAAYGKGIKASRYSSSTLEDTMPQDLEHTMLQDLEDTTPQDQDLQALGYGHGELGSFEFLQVVIGSSAFTPPAALLLSSSLTVRAFTPPAARLLSSSLTVRAFTPPAARLLSSSLTVRAFSPPAIIRTMVSHRVIETPITQTDLFVLLRSCESIDPDMIAAQDNAKSEEDYAMKLAKAAGHKYPQGFKKTGPGFMLAHIKMVLPGTKMQLLSVKNHVKTWHRELLALLDMVSASGTGWDDVKKQFDMTDEAWDFYVKIYPVMKGKREHLWVHYDDLVEIYGNDHAKGKGVANFEAAATNILAADRYNKIIDSDCTETVTRAQVENHAIPDEGDTRAKIKRKRQRRVSDRDK